jgi:hypothetical protein
MSDEAPCEDAGDDAPNKSSHCLAKRTKEDSESGRRETAGEDGSGSTNGLLGGVCAAAAGAGGDEEQVVVCRRVLSSCSDPSTAASIAFMAMRVAPGPARCAPGGPVPLAIMHIRMVWQLAADRHKTRADIDSIAPEATHHSEH